MIANHQATLAHQSPRLTFHAFEGDRVHLTPQQVASIGGDRVACAYYAQMVEGAWEHRHIFKLLLDLGIRDCYAVDSQLNVLVHSGQLGWVLPRRVGPYTLSLPALISESELNYLYDLSRESVGQGRVVEIGTMAGGSAVALALGSRDSGRTRVHTIDIHTRPEVRQTLEAHGVSDIVNVINLASKDAAASWPSFTGGATGIRMLWIDGDHSYDGVSNDILHWRDYVEPGGVICFHDYTDAFPGVIRAVYEHVVSSPMFEDFHRVDSIFSAIKRPLARSVSIHRDRGAMVPEPVSAP